MGLVTKKIDGHVIEVDEDLLANATRRLRLLLSAMAPGDRPSSKQVEEAILALILVALPEDEGEPDAGDE